jgi:hypothetical protein
VRVALASAWSLSGHGITGYLTGYLTGEQQPACRGRVQVDAVLPMIAGPALMLEFLGLVVGVPGERLAGQIASSSTR